MIVVITRNTFKYTMECIMIVVTTRNTVKYNIECVYYGLFNCVSPGYNNYHTLHGIFNCVHHVYNNHHTLYGMINCVRHGNNNYCTAIPALCNSKARQTLLYLSRLQTGQTPVSVFSTSWRSPLNHICQTLTEVAYH